jgi:hypothetical protein
MREIAKGVWNWTTTHERFGIPLQSYYVVDGDEAVVIDPRVPDEGLEWFDGRPRPLAALLTNRHHYRHSDRFRERFGTAVRCHSAGMHEFTAGEEVEPFEFGDALPAGFVAREMGVLCPEETALHHAERGVLALGDAVVRDHDGLGFVPEEHLGDDPDAVKRGLRASAARLLELEFSHLLLAHGEPFPEVGREKLESFARG